jgi:hypothetical protein
VQKAISAQQQRQTVTSSGSIFSNQEQHVSASSQSNFTSIVTKDVHTKSSASVISSSQVSCLWRIDFLFFGPDAFNALSQIKRLHFFSG